MDKRRMGVLGGTFDPVHVGHLRLAEAARNQLGLERVLFVPAGQPWRKLDREVTSIEHRLEMVRLAIEGEPSLELCGIEAKRSGASYTVETLEALAVKFPGCELVLVLGRDALEDMPSWQSPERIRQMALLAVAPRAGGRADEDRPGVRSGDQGIVRLEMVPVDVSSSEIRSRVRRGDSISGVVPAAVEAYIRQHGLYRE